jgi:hypothetical protein
VIGRDLVEAVPLNDRQLEDERKYMGVQRKGEKERELQSDGAQLLGPFQVPYPILYFKRGT